jgi:hypothetical protein
MQTVRGGMRTVVQDPPRAPHPMEGRQKNMIIQRSIIIRFIIVGEHLFHAQKNSLEKKQ